MDWFDEKIEYIKDDRFLYRIICFFMGGPKYKMSYKNLYLLLYGLNKNTLGEVQAKKKAMNRILKIYKDLNNNKLPDNLKL